MSLLHLAWASLRNRRLSVILCMLTIALSITLLLAVERIRVETRNSFTRTVSDTDLIVGARGSALQLLLYSVFRIGDAPPNFSWESYQQLAAHPDLAWSIPIALGDSHRGFRVLATDQRYFEHYRYAGGQPLEFSAGVPFTDGSEAVLGSEVAAALGYALADPIVLAHGVGRVSFANHSDHPFHVSGILAATGTPVDRTIHIDLAGLGAIHRDWQSGAHVPGSGASTEIDHHPDKLTAALLRLNDRVKSAAMQRQINQFAGEPLTAIQPVVALQQLWSLMKVAEQALRMVAAMMVASGLLGMTAVLVSTLGERRREMAVLRSVGASPVHVLGLLLAEACLLVLVGSIVAIGLFYAALVSFGPIAQSRYGLQLSPGMLSAHEVWLLLMVIGAALVAALLPALTAYRQSLSDGLNIRL